MIWQPPVGTSGSGTFRVLLSLYGYTTGANSLTISMGDVSALPVLGDYNGDGITDLGVLLQDQTSGSETGGAVWNLCYTKASVLLTTCSPVDKTVSFGDRRDVPFGGTNFDGNSTTGEIALYRPSTMQWFWAVSPYSGYSSASPFSADTTPSFVPLLDDYDADGKTDLAGYEPTTAKFRIVLASSSWTTAPSTTFTMSSDCIPLPGTTAAPGTAANRSGCTVVPGQSSWVSGVRYPEFVVWEPQGGVWTSIVKPGTSSYATSAVGSYGQPGDVPIGGLLPSASSSRSPDLAFFRYNGAATASQLVYLPGSTSACGSTSTAASEGVISERTRVFAVGDMSGDGLPDVVQYDQDQGVINWYTSDSCYATQGTPITIGNSLGEFL